MTPQGKYVDDVKEILGLCVAGNSENEAEAFRQN